MTRRSFIADLLKAGVATTFLPGAGRIWKPTYKYVNELRFVVPKPTRVRVNWYLAEVFHEIGQPTITNGKTEFIFDTSELEYGTLKQIQF